MQGNLGRTKLSWFNSRNYDKANLFTSQLSKRRRRDCLINDDDDGVFLRIFFSS
jgi:hypothetical protein